MGVHRTCRQANAIESTATHQLLNGDPVGFPLKSSIFILFFGNFAYQANFGAHASIGNVTGVGANQMPAFDVLTGGFPCQTFSLRGE